MTAPTPPPASPVPASPLPPIAPSAEFLVQCQAQGIEFEPGELDRLGRYLHLLLETNKSFNLTSITDASQAWMRHVFDSLTLLSVLSELPAGAAVIDIGSGGGLPGIPLAITSPGLQFTLLEATGKKADFLGRAVSELGLGNVQVLSERAERAGQDDRYREHFDAAVARAVGPMSIIAELSVPLVRVGGQVLLIKGQKADEELAAAKKALHMLHARHVGTVDTPTGRIVMLDKPRKTPAAYPRRDGEPKRSPL